ncbi:transcriptional regulator GlxA family with amidase domain [Kitasatospora sp. MAA4]|uniref:GlxA family transcriptional regulator n=1 Tax=Kitasatospora sp. MAA4 TaxID=3035093 RepID=UPI00247324C7|nr:helix-turn-helix domain-containing protein [Kitasatospora sp. MAA4]MDH6135849.1 transcriptional regulator GlxA family with amidase domain [Kitasatospora sp. MAA4]
MNTYRVGVLAFDGCFASEVFGFADLLTVANQIAAHLHHDAAPRFEVAVVAARRRVTASGGVSLSVGAVPDALDLLVVPGFELLPAQDLDARLRALGREVEMIRRVAGRAVPIASICLGAFLLGEAGLLDGRRATTAWLFARALAERYPQAAVDGKALLVDDAGVTTTGAFSTAFDLAMAVISRSAGEAAEERDEIARLTARVTLVPGGRTSQAPYVDDAIAAVTGRRFSGEVMQWLDARAPQPYNLSELAAAFHVSTRTMLRRFRTETGQSPLGYLQGVRVGRAKTLLESSDLRLVDVMAQVGYLDQGTFRRLFAAHTGLSPAEYRRRFGAGRAAQELQVREQSTRR